MNIVIVGAGEVGLHLASFLSRKNSNVVLIDKDLNHLERVSQNIDVGVRVGSGTDWQLLEELSEMSPDFLFALTGDEEANLVCCSIAKHLGYPKTVAKIKSSAFLSRTRLDFGRLFSVDHFICPEYLVAQDIFNYATESGAVQVESFAHGAVQMRTISIPDTWRKNNIPLCELNLPKDIVVSLINRKIISSGRRKKDFNKLIFPHGTDFIMAGDEVTIIGDSRTILDVNSYFDVNRRNIKSVVIVGGSLTAYFLAKALDSDGIRVKILDKDPERCQILAENLSGCTILNNDGTDYSFLQGDHVEREDLFVACTNHDEINIMASMVAKDLGCNNVLASISNPSSGLLLEKMGISHMVSPVTRATNRLFSLLRTDSVASMVSMYDEKAEVLEMKVSSESAIAGIPIARLAPSLPEDFLFAVIQNRGRILIANGNRILSPGDTVIVISSPKYIERLRKIF